MIHKELKAEILKWLLEHENIFNRVNACIEEFKPYIYKADGNYLIGGQAVSEFITEADKLLYGRSF